MYVTRIFKSKNLTQSKYDRLKDIAIILGGVRSDIWNRFGSLAGTGITYREIRDSWVHKKYISSAIPARLWKATLRDVIGDITAYREAAKQQVRTCIARNFPDPQHDGHRTFLYSLLRSDQWLDNPYLSRLMRKYWKRGHAHVKNQIIVDEQSYTWFLRKGKGWLSVQSFQKRNRIAIPLNTTIPLSGTLRLIIQEDCSIEVHAPFRVEPEKTCGTQTIGIDKGYTEVCTDSDGECHGEELGTLLKEESDQLKVTYQNRNKIRAIARKHAKTKPKKAARIKKHNLGRKKQNRKKKKHRKRVHNCIGKSVNTVVDKGAIIVTEDLTKTFQSSRNKKIGKNQKRRLSAWVKGMIADAFNTISLRRGATVVIVNPAYTSQICSWCGCFGNRHGDRFHCPSCGRVAHADYNAARNILARLNDPEIGLWTPYRQVRAILQERARQRLGLLNLGSSCIVHNDINRVRKT